MTPCTVVSANSAGAEQTLDPSPPGIAPALWAGNSVSVPLSFVL